MPDEEDPVSELEEKRVIEFGVDIDGDKEPDIHIRISGDDAFLKGYLVASIVMTLVYAGILYLV